MKPYTISEEFAEEYDRQSLKYGWFSPEIIFGLTFEYINTGQSLLDIGIGTGLSSELFHKAGLQVYGLDSSEKMLNICRSKNITIELKNHDLQVTPFPYPDRSFHHIVVNGVFHLIKDLTPIIDETSRLVKNNGILSFTFEENRPVQSDEYRKSDINGISEMINKDSGVRSYRHKNNYIEELLKRNKFNLLKQVDFLAFRKTPWNKEKYFKAIIVRKDNIR